MDWTVSLQKRVDDPLSSSFNETSYASLGCFPIGLDTYKADFDHVIKSQRRLRSLNLLGRYSTEQLHTAAATLRAYGRGVSRSLDMFPTSRDAISHLSDALAQSQMIRTTILTSMCTPGLILDSIQQKVRSSGRSGKWSQVRHQ